MSVPSSSPNWHPRGRIWIAGGSGLFVTAVFFFAIHFLAPPGSYLLIFFEQRSWIQYATTFIFWVTMAIIAYDHFQYRRELGAVRKGVEILKNHDIGKTLLWSEAKLLQDAFSAESSKQTWQCILFVRVRSAMERVHKTRSTKELDAFFRNRSEIDKDHLETSFAEVRYFVWLIPILGFIGTVMGIGQGIAGFASMLQSGQGGGSSLGGIQKALPLVTQQLGTAFDTTFLALLWSAVAVFYMSYLLKCREALVQEVDRICAEDITTLFQEDRGDADELVRAVEEAANSLRQAINGHRGSLEGVLRDELPVGLAAAQGELRSLVLLQVQLLAALAAQWVRQLPADSPERQSIETLVEQARALPPPASGGTTSNRPRRSTFR